jgi:hypothetical protein
MRARRDSFLSHDSSWRCPSTMVSHDRSRAHIQRITDRSRDRSALRARRPSSRAVSRPRRRETFCIVVFIDFRTCFRREASTTAG